MCASPLSRHVCQRECHDDPMHRTTHISIKYAELNTLSKAEGDGGWNNALALQLHVLLPFCQ